MSECGLCALDKRLAHVRDTEGGFVWGGDVVVDNRCEVDGDVVLSHADLLRDFNNLDLDVDLDELLRERVDLDETRVDCAVEASELRD